MTAPRSTAAAESGLARAVEFGGRHHARKSHFRALAPVPPNASLGPLSRLAGRRGWGLANAVCGWPGGTAVAKNPAPFYGPAPPFPRAPQFLAT